MPIYEYRCPTDGALVELIRPSAEADGPVVDPEGRGRTFTRVASTFATGGSGSGSSRAGTDLLRSNSDGCCPCGKSKGSCGSR